jgi:hypothetical protein
MICCKRLGAIVLVWAVLTESVGAQDRDEAQALVQRFIAHLNANTPIAGEFEIRGVFDAAVYERHLQDVAKINQEKMKNGARYIPEPDNRRLLCRWAFDRNREMLETLAGSNNVFKTFYLDRETMIEGFEQKVYNLEKPKDLATRRPASFYFLGGAARFTELLPEYQSFALSAAPQGAPEGMVTLTARKPSTKKELRLIIHRETCVLFEASLFVDSKPAWRLRIDELARGPDHRVFPKSAELIGYLPPYYDRPFRTETLQAKRIVFAQTQTEAEQSFALSLPKGASIADRMLNRSVTLEKPTSVQEVLTQPLPSIALEQPTVDMTSQLASPPSKRWYWLAGLVCAVAAVCVLIWAFQRRQRA